MAKKKKKKISKTEINLKNKIYYVNKKNKEIKVKIELFEDDKLYNKNSKKVGENFKGVNFKQKEKVKGSTLKNILRNKIKDNNQKVDKVYKTLKKRFKKDLKHKQTKVRAKKGLFNVSPLFRVWERIDMELWLTDNVPLNLHLKAMSDIINVTDTMGNYDTLQITYNLKTNVCKVFQTTNENDL